MVDEIRNIKEALFSVLSSALTGGPDGMPRIKLDLRGAKDLIGAIAAIAGKGKDEVVQLLCREFSMALAAMLKEPLAQLLQDKKLQVTLELVSAKKGSTTKGKRPSKH